MAVGPQPRSPQPRRASAWRDLGAVAFAALAAAAPANAQDSRDAAAFAAWRPGHDAAVREFERFLAEQGVAAVAPLHELLRSASAWQDCQAEPFALPPPPQWPAAAQVLRLLQALAAAGAIGRFEIHSTYREPRLNACAGGAARSAHLRAWAVDFTPADAGAGTPKLCAFWRRHGPEWAMGLGRYPSGRIHVDTAGFRSWGPDHTGRTAVCADADSPAQPPG